MTIQGPIADVLAGRADWALECRDGFALARELADGAVDHVIGDPPYDEKTHKGARTNPFHGEARRTGDDSLHIDFAVLPDPTEFMPRLLTISKRWILLFCTGTMLGGYERASGGSRGDGGGWVRDGYWHRTDSMPQISGDRPAQAGEAIAIMHRPGGKMKWNRGGASSVLGRQDLPRRTPDAPHKEASVAYGGAHPRLYGSRRTHIRSDSGRREHIGSVR